MQDPAPSEPITTQLPELWSELGRVDQVGLVLVVVLAALGFWRGMWWQVMRLVGLTGAILLTRTLSPRVAEAVLARTDALDPRLAHGGAWLFVFLLCLGVLALLLRLGRRLLEALELSFLDRSAGLVLGAATGLAAHLALVVVLVLLLPQQKARDTLAGTYSEGVLRSLTEELPFLVEAAEPTGLPELLDWDARAD